MMGTNGHRDLTAYEKKFANFIKLLAESPEEVVMVNHPNVLGDDYD